MPELNDCGRRVILLGGRSDARNCTTYPWLPEVQALLRDAVAADIPRGWAPAWATRSWQMPSTVSL